MVEKTTGAILTVHDREPEVLLAVLRSLARGRVREVIIADDGSTMMYDWLPAYLEERFERGVVIDVPAYERFSINGYGNPVRAWNAALAEAQSDRLLILSSDTLVSPQVLQRSLAWDVERGPWTPRVVDTDSQMEYCGPSRVFPMPWALVVSRRALVDAGGWDEAYLKGLCYDDNDIIATLTKAQGCFAVDWSMTAYHMSHDQPAYRNEPDIVAANERNREYCKAKWGCIPFGEPHERFSFKRALDPSGLTVYNVSVA